MCTAVSYRAQEHYFGRNLDFEYSYEESVAITPRNYPFHFRKAYPMHTHYAMIGIAYVKDEYPLYYDATNEKGLSMAGLHFPGNAVYLSEKQGMHNIAPFEFVPWVLAQCQTVQEAKRLLEQTNLIKIAYSEDLPLSPLHFLISDAHSSIVVEPGKDGLCISDNPVGVLTNNPPFPYQMHHLNNYMGLSRKEPVNRFAKEIPMEIYSRGMGAIGLPGDLSSSSRFVRASFVKCNSLCGETEEENVAQFFHILASVEQQKGCVKLSSGEYEYTIYSSCCNTERGIYYYRTYRNSTITAVDMHRENLDGDRVIAYPVKWEQYIRWEN